MHETPNLLQLNWNITMLDLLAWFMMTARFPCWIQLVCYFFVSWDQCQNKKQKNKFSIFYSFWSYLATTSSHCCGIVGRQWSPLYKGNISPDSLMEHPFRTTQKGILWICNFLFEENLYFGATIYELQMFLELFEEEKLSFNFIAVMLVICCIWNFCFISSLILQCREIFSLVDRNKAFSFSEMMSKD